MLRFQACMRMLWHCLHQLSCITVVCMCSRRFPRPHPRPHHRCGVGFASSSYYSDVQTRITDPSVFVVPSYCKKTPGDNTLRFGEDSSALHMEEDLPTILEHFVVL